MSIGHFQDSQAQATMHDDFGHYDITCLLLPEPRRSSGVSSLHQTWRRKSTKTKSLKYHRFIQGEAMAPAGQSGHSSLAAQIGGSQEQRDTMLCTHPRWRVAGVEPERGVAVLGLEVRGARVALIGTVVPVRRRVRKEVHPLLRCWVIRLRADAASTVSLLWGRHASSGLARCKHTFTAMTHATLLRAPHCQQLSRISAALVIDI